MPSPAPGEGESPALGQAGAEQLENSSAENDLGVLVDTRLARTQQRSLAAKVTSSLLGRSREVILPICPALVGPHLEFWVQCWAPQDRRDMDTVERVQQRAMKLIK